MKKSKEGLAVAEIMGLVISTPISLVTGFGKLPGSMYNFLTGSQYYQPWPIPRKGIYCELSIDKNPGCS